MSARQLVLCEKCHTRDHGVLERTDGGGVRVRAPPGWRALVEFDDCGTANVLYLCPPHAEEFDEFLHRTLEVRR